jgi:hypothetical protein
LARLPPKDLVTATDAADEVAPAPTFDVMDNAALLNPVGD